MAKGSWQVSEAEYTPSEQGPGEDTETFYAGTPAPGQREHFDEPPTQPSLLSRATPAWIKRVARPSTRKPAESEPVSVVERVPVPLWVIPAGVVVLSGMVIVTMVLGWFLFSPAKVSESSRSAKQDVGEEEQQDEEFEGVKVKKGLH